MALPAERAYQRGPEPFTSDIEVSIVMPCLNEEASVGFCIEQAQQALDDNGIKGEIIVSDNGSKDKSAQIAQDAGARVVFEDEPGYGSAYLRGFQAARGKYIIMADSDGTYDFRLIPDFLEPLRKGQDMVMGTRLTNQMEKDAMPLSHKYIGVPILTRMLNVVAGGTVADAHCGMRSFTRDALVRMNLNTTGMEFASEMIVKAIRLKMTISEIPIPYYARVGESKLRTWRDGWRHLRFLLLESPTLLFMIPGLTMMIAGLATLIALTPGKLQLGGITFDFHYMVVGALLAILGWQVLSLGIFAKVFGVIEGLAPPDNQITWFMRVFTLEKALVWSSIAALAGTAILVWVLTTWIQQGFGFTSDGIMLRPALLGMTLLVIGMGSIFSSFFISALTVQRRIGWSTAKQGE